MMQWFRRQRLLAALLTIANPALLGSWVAAYHPCPVSDEWAVGRPGGPAVASIDEHAGHDGMALAETPAPSHDHSQNDGHCACIGACLTAGIALPSFTGDEVRFSVEITQHSAPSTLHQVASWATAPLDLLPPSTAPPIA